MRLPKLAIDSHKFTIIFFFLLVMLGIVSFLTMPRSEDPAVSAPGTTVLAVLPGATPADIEELLIDPIEESINELDELKRIYSSSTDGLGLLQIEYNTSADVDEKYREIVQKVGALEPSLPDEIIKLETIKWEVSDVSILQIALVSDSVSYRILEKDAERLKSELEKTSGVRKVKIHAAPEQEIRVSLNIDKMMVNNIPVTLVFKALAESGANIPGGSIKIGNKQLNVITSGTYDSIEEIRNTVVSTFDGYPVYLKDIASVEHDYEDQKYYARFNGKRAVWVTATQKEGTNIFDVSDELKARVSEFEKDLSAGINLEYVFDQSKSVDKRVSGFFMNLLQGLALVGIVVLLSFGFKASIVVILAIPISIFIGIGLIDLSGYGLQQMTIAGLVIALGLLVDNAIVVTENVSRFIKQGYSRKEAAALGTSQIGWAVVSSTVTTVLAFIPMMMIGDVTGDFIRSMPMTVVYTLSASLLVSLTLTPLLLSKVLKKYITENAIENKNLFRKTADSFVETTYRKLLDFALKRPVLTLFAAFILWTGAMSIFPLIGISFFPKADKPQFIINVKAPIGTNIDRTSEVTYEVEEFLSKRYEVSHFATNIGHGNPRIYYNVMEENDNPSYAMLFVETKDPNLNEFTALLEDIREKFIEYPGAKIEVKELEQGPPIEAPVAIKIIGENLDELRRISKDVESIIENTPGTLNIVNPLSSSKSDLKININRDKAALYGVSLLDIDRVVRAGIAGLPITKFRDNEGKEYDIVVRLPFKGKVTVEDIEKLNIPSAAGPSVPLSQIARIEFSSSPFLISHFNMERSVTVTADVLSDGYNVNSVTNQIIRQLDNYDLPKGFRYYVGGEQESRSESFGGMIQAVLIAMIGILAVLVLQFRSYIQPAIILVTIPLALIGSMIALFITGYSFSFTAFVGLTSLIGIVINNSILLVDYTNQLRRDGRGLLDAIKEAGETRFMPIALTTATTVGGLLPLTLTGGSMWAPMGWTIIGGLVVSTFMTLIIVPVLYMLSEKVARYEVE